MFNVVDLIFDHNLHVQVLRNLVPSVYYRFARLSVHRINGMKFLEPLDLLIYGQHGFVIPLDTSSLACCDWLMVGPSTQPEVLRKTSAVDGNTVSAVQQISMN